MHSFCDQQSLLLVEEREVWGRCREKLVLLSVEVLMVYNISFERKANNDGVSQYAKSYL